MENGSLVTLFAETIIRELLEQGISYFCLSPGSRSTPLTLAVANSHAKSFVHFDERSMAFHALGFAKASKKPVVIITTSGTACGNLLPAIMEAHESLIPLIVLTSDRPVELQFCGANQTTNQNSLFENFVRLNLTLPSPEALSTLPSIKSHMGLSIKKALSNPPGPIHINCQFREPFFSNEALPPLVKKSVFYFSEESTLKKQDYEELALLLNQSKKPLILCGYESLDKDSFQAVTNLAEKINAPIFCDILSNHLTFTKSALCLHKASFYTKNPNLLEDLHPDLVLHFGGAFVSKFFFNFLKEKPQETYLHVHPFTKREDPYHLITHSVTTTCKSFSETITPLIEEKPASFLKDFHLKESFAKELQKSYFEEHPALTEPSFFHLLSQIDLSDWNLFLPNSMPVRDAGDFFTPKSVLGGIFGLRGLSGIDGNLSAATGIAKATKKSTLCILGDLTFLHDLTALSQLKTLDTPFVVLVINNNGGCIFRNLPIFERKDVYTDYFEVPHNLSFSKAAELFSLPYFNFSSQDTDIHFLEKQLEGIFASKKSCFVELQIKQEATGRARKELSQLLQKESLLTC